MSPRYGVRVDNPGGYSLELTSRGETLMYRSPDVVAQAQVWWKDENGTLHAHLVTSTLRLRGGSDSLPDSAQVIARMVAFLGDDGQSAVSLDRSPPGSAADALAEYIARAEATGEWRGEQRADGTWAIRRTRSPKDSK